MAFKNPFLKIDSPIPGSGEVHLSLLPPANVTFKTLTYTYPLKLVPSAPHTLDPSHGHDHTSEEVQAGGPASSVVPKTVPLLFLLSYGGGLLPPDSIDLKIHLDPSTRLTIATQGSTKIFPSTPFQQPRFKSAQTTPLPSPPASPQFVPSDPTSITTDPLPTATQTLHCHLSAHSALCYTPDPTQPFRGSKYHQRQIFTMHPTASLLLLDWTTEGRRARGESWDAELWRSCTEIWRELPEMTDQAGKAKTRLQLRDHIILESPHEGPKGRGLDAAGSGTGHGMKALKEQKLGCFGTLIAVGPLVEKVGEFFMQEFESLPRVGGRDWGDEKEQKTAVDDASEEGKERERREAWHRDRLKLEKEEGVLWTSARVRGLVVVKFAARDFKGARNWLGQMLNYEGTVKREFGDGGLLCVR